MKINIYDYIKSLFLLLWWETKKNFESLINYAKFIYYISLVKDKKYAPNKIGFRVCGNGIIYMIMQCENEKHRSRIIRKSYAIEKKYKLLVFFEFIINDKI